MAPPWDAWRWQYSEVDTAEVAVEEEPPEGEGVREPSTRTLFVPGHGSRPSRLRWVLVAALSPLALLGGLALGRRGLHRTRHTGSTVDDYVVRGWEPAAITWATHPEKCWDVNRKESGNFYNGMQIQIWDCDANPDKFMVPAGGFGPIKLADNPEYCLDAPGNSSTLQFWRCSEAPRANTLFVVPFGKKGLIQPANDKRKCVDVPRERTYNGAKVQQWRCSDHLLDEIFVIHWPVDCRWTGWSEWSDCSGDCKKARSRSQYASKQDRSDGQEKCVGHEEQEDTCDQKECKPTTISFDSFQHLETMPKPKSYSARQHPASSAGFGLLCAAAAVESLVR
mmetsp:Transcript_104797/g.291863  ORF Transcript_104797/g.291863 Transcript_104797/m.291863 type:complete len:337 (-) Transcript_104797:81-1091(-)